MTDFSLLEQIAEPNDVVFHLASMVNVRESLADPALYFRVNVDGTLSVLEALRKYQKRLIFVSSCAVYGNGSMLKKGELFTEESALLPVDPYGASKVAADRLCYAYHKSYGLDITIVRPFTTYGPGQKGWPSGGLISIIIEKAMKGEKLSIFGDGSAVRDFLYIDDLIDAYMLILNSKDLSGATLNVGSSLETSVYEAVKYVADKFQVEIEYLDVNQHEVKRYVANIEKIKALGFSPKFDIKSGIDSYVSSFNT